MSFAPSDSSDFRTANFCGPAEFQHFLAVLQGGLQVRTHLDIFHWMQGGFQDLIPHDVFIAAWGDFSHGVFHFDVISGIPGVRTEHLYDHEVSPFLMSLFDGWSARGRMPLHFGIEESLDVCRQLSAEFTLPGIEGMESVVVHGIKDHRGQHDCLFVALSEVPVGDDRVCRWFEVLLPYVDSALRQVVLLPEQECLAREGAPVVEEAEAPVGSPATVLQSLSNRELEIMRWVALGKTNVEIGLILGISSFTVKNHLQRIFRKLNVLNRAQGVAIFESFSKK